MCFKPEFQKHDKLSTCWGVNHRFNFLHFTMKNGKIVDFTLKIVFVFPRLNILKHFCCILWRENRKKVNGFSIHYSYLLLLYFFFGYANPPSTKYITTFQGKLFFFFFHIFLFWLYYPALYVWGVVYVWFRFIETIFKLN